MTKHEHPSSEFGPLPYRLHSPSDVGPEPLPLVVFLHGAGERGDDNERQLVHGVGDLVSAEAQAKHPCFVVAPQCPKGTYWPEDRNLVRLMDLVQYMVDEMPVDPSRVYVTGLSMGGYGTWAALSAKPELFAAAVPICGGGDPKLAERYAHVPIWAFHGDADRVVPADRTREIVAALREAGGSPRYTEYPGVAHNSWTQTYANREVHDWMFLQRRPQPMKKGERVVFLGDSITQAGFRRKNGYGQVAQRMLKERHPELEFEFVGAGISGHKVPNLQERLKRDVLDKDPSVVIIYIGINDVWHWNRDRGTPKDKFELGLQDIITRIRGVGARVILCTPSVIGERIKKANKFDEMLEEYSSISRGMAAGMGVQLLDLRYLFRDYLTRNNEEDLERGVLTTDGVHLNEAGNVFVAEHMLSALGAR